MDFVFETITRTYLASLPGLPSVQLLITCRMQKQRKAWSFLESDDVYPGGKDGGWKGWREGGREGRERPVCVVSDYEQEF